MTRASRVGVRLLRALVAVGLGATVNVWGVAPAAPDVLGSCTARGALNWTVYGSPGGPSRFILVNLTAASTDPACEPYLGSDGSVTMFGSANKLGACDGTDVLEGLGLVDYSTNTWFSQREAVPFPGPVPIDGGWSMTNDSGSATEYRADVAISTRVGGLCPPDGSPDATLRFVPIVDRPTAPVSGFPRVPLCAARGPFSLEAATPPSPYSSTWSVPFRIESTDTRCSSVLGFGGSLGGYMVASEIGRCSGGLTAQFFGVGSPSHNFGERRYFSQVAAMPFPGPVVGTVGYGSTQVPFAMVTRIAGQCPPAGSSDALWLFGLPPGVLV
jgi:hypothetical protein